MVQAGPFITLLRRLTHSGYKELIMNNRMFVQCYDLDIDSDVGFHYAMYIPETSVYEDEFYDSSLLIDPRAVLTVYSNGHKILNEKKKELKAKPKEINEEFILKRHGDVGELKFMFYISDELITTTTCKVDLRIDTTNQAVSNVEKTFSALLDRIKPGGVCLLFDGLRMGIMNSSMDASEIYFYTVRYHGKKLKVPFAKSMFLGLKDADQFLFSIQESVIPDIYVYSIQLTKKKLTEQIFGFVMSF